MDLKCSTQPGVLNTSAWVGGSTLRLAKPLQSEPMAKIGHWRLTFERCTQPLAPVFLSAPGQLWYEPFLTLFLRKPLSRFPHHDSLKPSTTGNQKKNSSLKWLYWVFDRSIKNPFKGIPQWPNFFQTGPIFKKISQWHCRLVSKPLVQGPLTDTYPNNNKQDVSWPH